MINILDVVGIVLFLFLFILVLKRYWFYSLYSFLRFLLFSIVALGSGLFIASLNPFDLFFSKLQIALFITALFFTLLWRFVSFKKIFFWLDTHLFKVDRFVYFHKLNKIINIPPSLVASSFFTFFLFSIAVSLSPYNSFLEHQIESSKVLKPLSFKVYFSPGKLGKFNLNPFEGTVFDLPNPLSPSGRGILETIRRPYVIETATKINEERTKAGLPPISEVPIEPSSDVPSQIPNSDQSAPSPSTPRQSPIVIKIPSFPSSSTPTATPVPQSLPTPTPQPSSTSPQGPQADPTSTPAPLPTATPTPTPTPAQIPRDTRSIEQRIFELTNEKRSENGVRALSWSEDIAAVARSHSKDMVDRNYFSHNSPEGVTPFQRLTIGGISYSTAGENIATAGTAELIMNAWMNSPGHRANILNGSFGKIGIGVVENARYGLMATQNFTN